MSVSGVSSAVSIPLPTATASTDTATVSSNSTSATTTSSSAPSTAGGDGTGPVATQVMQWASIVADGSGASTEDKANAFVAIYQAIGQTGSNGDPSQNSYFQQTTLAQRQTISQVIFSSSFANQSQAAYQQYAQQANANNAKAAGGDVPPSESGLAYVNSLSSDQQQLLFASIGGGAGFSSLAAWKVQLQTDQNTMAADYAADNGGSPAVTVTLSDSAKTALAGSSQAAASSSTTSGSTTTDASSKALKTLSTPSTGTSADVALAVLQSAAQAKAAAEAQKTSDTASSAQDRLGSANDSTRASGASSDTAYHAGDRVSVTA